MPRDTLTLAVNGQIVTRARDAAFLNGGYGFQAYSTAPGLTVTFNSLVVLAPRP